MKTYQSSTLKILLLELLLSGLSLTSCGMAQGNLHAINVKANASAPVTVTSSTNTTDTTAPEIEALDVTIPYGSFLRLADIAAITDDQDESPVLEIVLVVDMNAKESQKTVDSEEGATLSNTEISASASTTALEAVEVKSGDNLDNNGASVGSTEITAATDNSETAVSTDTNEITVTAESDEISAATDSTEIASVAVTSETAAEIEPTEPGYLFSIPGKFSMLLKGTDKSGNESTKEIIITVTDKTAPVYAGLHENFEITDKDKIAPDYLEGVKANDEIDGDVTSVITADDSNVQYGKAGTYNVAYSVADHSGNTAKATNPVIIKDTTAPSLIIIKPSFNLFVTDKKPDYISSVTAFDIVDGDVKDSLKVDDSSVKYKHPGEYTAVFSVQDKSGNVAEKAVPVIISAGWKTQNGNTFYYSTEDGHLNHNWSYIDDKWYYFDSNDGHMLTGMQTIDERQYLLDDIDGHMITGWQTIDGKKYYFSPDDGHMYHDWSHIDGKEYFFDRSEGYMLTGSQTIDDRQYLLDDIDGHMITGWQTIDGKKYYFSLDDGHMYHDWSHIDGKEYFFDRSEGYMLTGSQTIDGRQYLLDRVNGNMITGWQTIDDKKYYYSPDDGHMYHDWSTIDGTEYYFDKSDGHMYTGTHYIDGVEYDFGTSGAAREVVQQRSTSSSGSRSYSDYAYIGNANSRKFHKSSCSSVRDMKDYNKVGFDSRSEAIDAGYQPCKRCHP